MVQIMHSCHFNSCLTRLPQAHGRHGFGAISRFEEGKTMAKITRVRTTVWEWVGPVQPLPPNFCATPSDLVADQGDRAPFAFLGWLIVEIECDDGTIGIGNAALAPHPVKVVIDTYLAPLLI